MATNKPPAPHIPFFDGWSYWCLLIVLLVSIPAFFQISPVGDMPVSTWWWYVGLVVFLFAIHVVRYRMLVRRNSPKWTCAGIRPWSDPLQSDAGGVVDFWSWYMCSSGLSLQQAEDALKDPGRKHQVEHDYSLYLIEYGKTYG